MNFRVEAKPHWINGWFLRLFSKPTLVVDSKEFPLSWSGPTEVEIDESRDVAVGVGVRYFGKGKPLGLHMTELDADVAAHESPAVLTFRNGFWNHDPFVLVTRNS